MEVKAASNGLGIEQYGHIFEEGDSLEMSPILTRE